MTESGVQGIALRPSRLLAGALALLHLLALASAWISLEGGALALVAAGIALSAAQTVAQALQLWPGSARRLRLHPDGHADWVDSRDRWHPCRVSPASYRSPYLVVMGLRGEAFRARWLALLPDSADAEDLRRLRVWLGWPRLDR